MRCRSGLMALSVMRDAPVLMEVANPSSQDRTPRRAIPLAASPAAGPYRASGLVLWRKAAVRGAILGSAAEGKTIAAKRGSRGALELWPTIEQGTNWPLNLVPVCNFLSGQIQASLGERVLPFHVNAARTPSLTESESRILRVWNR